MSTLKIITLIAFLISGVLYHPSLTEADNVAPHKSPQGYIRQYAKEYGVSQDELLSVSKCESGFKPDAWNKLDPNGGSKGIFQFQEKTFYSYAKILNIENPNIWDIEQQSKVASYMFSNNLKGQWSCSRIIGIIK